TRVPVPATNLKERIAALEQRQASQKPNSSRPVSPSPGAGPTAGPTAAPAGAFRDKIAKFEKKGGVPVPRGRFGLGAPPPTSQGPSRELYGNLVFYPPVSVAGDRRSFSLSSPDYTPLTSPTFAFPLDSPETTVSITPEVSPSLSTNGDAATFQRPIALDIARNAEHAKIELTSPESTTPTANGQSPAEHGTPAIVVSAEEAPPAAKSHKDADLTDGPSSEAPPQHNNEEETKIGVQAELTSPIQPAPSEETIGSPLEQLYPATSKPAMIIAPIIEVTPLTIRKRQQSISQTAAEKNGLEDEKEEKGSFSKEEEALDASLASPDLPSSLQSSPGVPPPRYSSLHHSFFMAQGTPAPSTSPDSQRTRPLPPPPAPVETAVGAEAAPPSIRPERKSSTSNDPRNATLTLNSGADTRASAASLTDVLTTYFVGPATPPIPEASPGPKRSGASIKPPDPSSFLSPPQTGAGLLSGAASSANSSMGSFSSLGSRPMTLRMTPATSRGVPMFLPPTSTSRPRKSDFDMKDKGREGDDEENGETEFGSVVVLHNATRANTVTGGKTFTAVVHGKIKETTVPLPSASASINNNRRNAVPQTPQQQVKRNKSETILETPLKAMLLEDTLSKGTLPAELADRSNAVQEKRKLETIKEAGGKAKEEEEAQEERRRIAAAQAQLATKRDDPTSGKSQHRKEVSAPAPASGPLSSRGEKPPVPTQSNKSRPATPENYGATPRPPQTPSNFGRKLSGRPTTIHGGSTARHNSQPVATPPEGMLEFGMMNLSGISNASQTSTSSLGRATSFAEKMWSRARTKLDDSVPRLPVLGPPPALELSSMPSIAQPRSSIEQEVPVRVVNPPKRTTSLKRYNDLPPIPSEPLPPLPPMFDSLKSSTATTSKAVPNTPTTSRTTSQAPQLPQLPDVSISDISNDSLLTPGFTADSASRSSWTSMSSAGSLPSPLFDKDLFDAFPSVPGTTPQPDAHLLFGGKRETATIPMGAAAAAVSGVGAGVKQPLPFDAALLSSAIHLQGRRSGETAR
ncbi:hypothetical protein CPB84DRAFT_1761611, partial [Gymnopilus junonius]